MKKGAVAVDVAVDQGGCFETTQATTHSDPVYTVDGVIHYCVANMPGRRGADLDLRARRTRPSATASSSPTRASSGRPRRIRTSPRASTPTAASSPTRAVAEAQGKELHPAQAGARLRAAPAPEHSVRRCVTGDREEVPCTVPLPDFALALSALALALPALAEMRIEKTLKLAPGGEFRLDTDMGKVTLVGSSEPDVHVVVTSRRKDLDELMTFRWDESPGLVSITAAQAAQVRLVLELGRQASSTRSAFPPRPASRSRPPAAASRSPASRARSARTPRAAASASRTSSATSRPTPRAAESPFENIKGRVTADTSGGGVEADRASTARSAPRAPAARSSSSG